jgi:hypothetical protein
MRTITIKRPGWIGKGEKWDLTGYTFDVDDGLSGVERDILLRRQAIIAGKARRLHEEGSSLYEDEASAVVLANQYSEARKSIISVKLKDKKLEPSEVEELLEGLLILVRDEVSKAVVEANSIPLKNV